MKYSIFYREALRRWGRKAAWITGDGPFALLAYCDVLTITLHMTEEDAIKVKEAIDQLGCGHACTGRHEIIDLRAKEEQ